MSPLMMRVFTLVGIALAAASMQSKAHADGLPQPMVVPAPAAGVPAVALPAGVQQS